MANPLYEALGQGQVNDEITQMMNAFPQYMQMMRGKNPLAVVNHLLSSGRLTQQQLNAAYSRIQGYGNVLDKFKTMFGYR